MGTIILDAKELTRSYGRDQGAVHALRGVSLTICEGENIAIIGPSGSGKSTLLQILALLDSPTSGSLTFLDKDATKLSDNALSELRGKFLGFIFQSFHLLPKLTVEENVALPLVYQGMGAKARRIAALSALERVGLSHRVGHRPHEISGGERQRVAIARAIVHRPKILFADEPTGNLDSKVKMSILDDLRRLNESERMTIVTVTHDDATAQFSQRVIRIRDGLIEQGETL